MQKQPASDSGLPAQGDGAGTPAKPSTAHTPKPSALRPGQAKPKPVAKLEAKPKPSAQTPAGTSDAAPKLATSGSEATKKVQETLPASSAAKPKPPSITPAKGKPSASTMNSDIGKPAVKPVISPADLAKPKPQTSLAPKPLTPAADGKKPEPGTKNIAQPVGTTTPASPATLEVSQKAASKAPKPGPELSASRPAPEAKVAATPVAQPKPGNTPAAETAEPVKPAEPVKLAEPLAKTTTAKPAPPKKPLANSGDAAKTPDSKPAPHVLADESNEHAVESAVTKPVTPSAPKPAAPGKPNAPAASKKSVKPTPVGQAVKAEAQEDKPAQNVSAQRAAQPPVDGAQSQAPKAQNPAAQRSDQNPEVEPAESTASTLATAPRAESLDSRTEVNNAGSALSEPEGSAPAEALGVEPDETPVTEPAKHPEPSEAGPLVAPAAQNTRARASSGLMSLLLGVSFVLEVALLGAVAMGAMWALPQLNPIVAILVTVLPLMILWGLFMSPKASFRIASVMHAILAHTLFAGGAVLLFLAGQPVLAIGMGVLTLLSLVLTLIVGGQGAITEAVAARKTSGGGSSGPRKGSGRRAAR